MRLPLLVRFSDILRDRLARLQSAFAKAMREWDYPGGYTAIYPIKVNQQKGVAGELAASGGEGFGLEAGSKPELMAVLALARPGSVVICNGYKDREYVRLALIGRKLGLEIYIVIEKPSELAHVIEEARALGVEPLLGVRMRLASLGAGKWQNTGGDKGKFGLTPRQLLDLLDQLEAREADAHAEAAAFPHGLADVERARHRRRHARGRALCRRAVERAGVAIDYVDVGGGLGVDYEGTRSRSECSINYGLDQYASTIVQPLAEAVEEHGFKPPRVLTESGRAMTAHHAVLVVNVTEVEQAPRRLGAAARAPTSRSCCVIFARFSTRSIASADRALPRSAIPAWRRSFAVCARPARARRSCAPRRSLLRDPQRRASAPQSRRAAAAAGARRAQRQARRQVLRQFLGVRIDSGRVGDRSGVSDRADRGLDRAPDRRGVIADLTCDSDGRIDQYVDSDGVDVSLPLHALREGEPYRLGIFLVGAYQETLGDIHNLFGDTDAVNVRVNAPAATSSRTSSAATLRTSCSITSATILARCARNIATRSRRRARRR